jgi:hypothetical protein
MKVPHRARIKDTDGLRVRTEDPMIAMYSYLKKKDQQWLYKAKKTERVLEVK